MKIRSAAVVAAGLALLTGCGKPPVTVEMPAEAPSEQASGRWEIGANGLQIRDIDPGYGRQAKSGDLVKMHYTGWLLVNGTRGTMFESSYDGEPLVFTLGAGQVIPGWDQGITGMLEGGKREIIIPPELAYGRRGMPGVIPPGATLDFEVELVEVVPRG